MSDSEAAPRGITPMGYMRLRRRWLRTDEMGIGPGFAVPRAVGACRLKMDYSACGAQRSICQSGPLLRDRLGIPSES